MSALLAFSIATGVVGATAFVGIQARTTVLEYRECMQSSILLAAIFFTNSVHQVDDFTQRMHTHIPRLFPHVRQMLHRALESDADSPLQGDHQGHGDWDYERSRQRLSQAYAEGGLDHFAKAAVKELKMESRWLLEKRRREEEPSQQAASKST